MLPIVLSFTHYCKVFIIAAFMIIPSSVFSIPLHTAPTTDKYRDILEEDVWNETGESSSIVPHTLKSKWPLSSKIFKHDLKLINQKPRIKKSGAGVKRGMDIGIQIRVPSTKMSKYNKDLNKLEEVLEKALEGNLAQVLNTSACPKCDEDITLPPKRYVRPAYKCDEWDAKYRLCILERNIGDTVTFYLFTGDSNERKINVTWKKEFHMRDSKSRTGYTIEANNPPENIIIGKQGYELRISPIAETDVGYNLFSASLDGQASAHSKVYFMIRIVPVDLGFVYVGETIELNLRSYISFPAESFTFRWYMEKFGEHSTLPSNMRTSPIGSSIKISELRQEQEGILACSLYTNLNFLATRKRFLIKDLIKNNDVLKSPPDHSLKFEEENIEERRKRYPKQSARHKKDIKAEEIEKAFMEPTAEQTSTMDSKKLDRTTHSNDDYDIEMDIGNLRETIKPKKFPVNKRNKNSSEQVKGISLERNPVDVEESDANNLFEENYPEQNGYRKKIDTSTVNDLNDYKHKTPFNRNSAEQVSSAINKESNEQSNPIDYPEASISSKNTNRNRENLFDIDVRNENEKFDSFTEDSGIILNIEKMPGPRRITAEEKIAKLISSCVSDYECSGAATCVKSNLNQAGFCKCLPSFYGVGVFCREDIWISKNNFDIEGLHNPNDVSYSSNLPLIES